jgi:uncharacterized protein
VISIWELDDRVSFEVKVHPRAHKNAITGEVGGALKLSLTAPPANGRANEACIEFFANLLKVPRSSVTIAAGQSSRNKVIRVAGVTAKYVRDRAAAEVTKLRDGK